MNEALYVVRHGRTSLNREGRFRGRRNPPLDDIGRAEAEATAKLLADAGLTAIYSSPLARATQTAESIATVTGVGVRVLHGLTDLDYGRWEGLTPAEAREVEPVAFERFLELTPDACPPGGESIERLKKRALRCIQQIREHQGSAPASVVTHEMVIRALLSEWSSTTSFWGLQIGTGSVHQLSFAGPGFDEVTTKEFDR